MSYNAGSARASYELDISATKKAAEELRRIFKGIRDEAAKLGTAPSGGGAAPLKQQSDAALKAALAQQKLATETQHTAAAQAQAARAAQSLATEENRTAREAANTAAAQDRAAKSALSLAAAQQRAANAGRNGGLGPALPRSLDGLTGSAAQVALGFISIQAAQRAFTFVKTGAEVADVTTSFSNLAVAAHTTGESLLGSLRAASNSTITDAALIKSANLGLLLTQGRIAKDLPALTRIAQASAKATGQSVDFVFESLVKGISRGSAKIIDNAGITLDGEKAYADYAKSIGKTADQLTKAEQQQAVLNAVVQEGNQIVKDAGINADDASVKIAAAQTAVQNLLTALATKAAPVAGSIAGGITDLINTGGVAPGAVASGDAVNANLVSKGQNYQQYAAGVVAANDQLQRSMTENSGPISVLINSYVAARLGLSALTPAQFAYAQSLIQTGVGSAQAFAAAQRLTEVNGAFSEALRNSTDTARAHRAELEALAPQIFEVANQSDHNNIAVQGLLQSYAAGTTTLPGLIEALNSLSRSHDIASQAAFQEEREMRNLARSFVDVVPAANAAAAAIAGAISARDTLPENRHIGGTGNTVGDIISGIGGGAGGLSGRQDTQQQALQASRDALALARAKTSAQKIAIYEQQLARQATEEGRNRILALIESEKRSGSGRIGAAQNTALQLNDIARTSGDDRLRIERENLERLRDQQIDFDVKSSRSREDFERQKRRLLAEGKRFEAKELEDKFNLDQQRAREDFDREKRRTQRNNAEALGDQATKVDNRLESIDARAVARGVRVGGTGTASLGGGTPPASLGAAGAATAGGTTVIQVNLNAVTNLDTQKVGELIFDVIHQKLDDTLALEIRSATPPGGSQQAVAGARP